VFTVGVVSVALVLAAKVLMSVIFLFKVGLRVGLEEATPLKLGRAGWWWW
jgi:hypothetical protein